MTYRNGIVVLFTPNSDWSRAAYGSRPAVFIRQAPVLGYRHWRGSDGSTRLDSEIEKQTDYGEIQVLLSPDVVPANFADLVAAIENPDRWPNEEEAALARLRAEDAKDRLDLVLDAHRKAWED